MKLKPLRRNRLSAIPRNKIFKINYGIRENEYIMPKSKYPILNTTDVCKEIYKRTSTPSEISKKVIETFADIVFDAIEAGVEVKFGRLGYFSWLTAKPRKNAEVGVTPFVPDRTYMDLPGYRTPKFRAAQKWRTYLRSISLDFTGIEKMGKYKELEEEQKGED